VKGNITEQEKVTDFDSVGVADLDRVGNSEMDSVGIAEMDSVHTDLSENLYAIH
jgi:hypothetical protein